MTKPKQSSKAPTFFGRPMRLVRKKRNILVPLWELRFVSITVAAWDGSQIPSSVCTEILVRLGPTGVTRWFSDHGTTAGGMNRQLRRAEAAIRKRLRELDRERAEILKLMGGEK